MENLVKILKQLTGMFSMVGTVPRPVRMAILWMTAIVGIVAIIKFAPIGSTEKTFLVILIILLVLITSGYYAWKYWKQKQQNQQFGGEINQHSSATPRSVSDPGQRARLDDLRKRFQVGIEAYKSRGKDLYKLPWYVIVGEPGSGKTEAIRHSNVGFPPGLQDEFQGVGGTINMNWWFTNHAVLLDTAGRLMFEDVKPGETSEWKEFLGLLKKNRPNCPINGLFLVIPSDSLIKDTAEAIQQKAGKIAQQLDVIQRVLDVRFPVFVVVTKCDKMNGFREFFDGLTDPQLQHQMMGWSNPDPLDEPFKPEMVDRHLEQVAARLHRRRLGLMRDPVPENPDGRRIDEIDSLYAFPHSLELISSRLRTYLGTIFVAGEWSAKPLFLRGIYFSSSMREGAALDAELAEAIGVGVDELPEGKVWERERAYFLRDLFLEKVFRERGLVTRASNTKRMLRSQQIALYSFGFLGLALFTIVAWLAMNNLRGGVKDQGDYWHVVSSAGWDNKFWKQSIVPIRGDGSFASTISTNVLTVDNKTITLGEFQSKLRDLAEQPLKRNIMFPGLADRYNQNRHKAQRIVFEGAVVRPLIAAARQKMAHDDGQPGNARWQPDALAELIRIESDIILRGTGTNNGEINREAARRFLTAFQNFIAGREVPLDTNMVEVMAWTYSSNNTARGTWAPRWFTGVRNDGPHTLIANPGINAGLDYFVRSATNSIQVHMSDWNQISAVSAAAKGFAESEQALFAASGANADETRFTEAQRAVDAARKKLDEELARASKLAAFNSGFSLTNAQRQFQSDVTGSAGAALGRVREVTAAAIAGAPDFPLFNDIKTRLDGIEASLNSRIAQLLSGGDVKEFERLDDTCLLWNAFATRSDLYSRADRLATEKRFENTRLVGFKGEQLEKLLAEEGAKIQSDAAAYTNRLKEQFARAMAAHMRRVDKSLTETFFTAYFAEAKRELNARGGFPLVRDMAKVATLDNFQAAASQLKFIADDFASPVFKKHPPEQSETLKAFVADIQSQQAIAAALRGDDGIMGTCTILLAGSVETTRNKDAWRERWRNLRLVHDGSANESVRTQDEGDQKLGDAPVQLPIELRLVENVLDSSSMNFPIRTSEWGPLWLIHKHNGVRDRVDPKTWHVEVPVTAPGSTGAVRLKLKFERPLPELDKWPAS